MEDKLFTLLGLGVPFYLAAATYAVFSWLDGNASDEATKVISSWLHGRSKNKPDLGNLIINAFDRIYTSPLLSLRAFRRLAAISSIIWLLVFLVPTTLPQVDWSLSSFIRWFGFSHAQLAAQVTLIFTAFIFMINLVAVIVTDYVSLLLVRRFLDLARERPIGASVLSSIAGLVVVATGFFMLMVILFSWMVLSSLGGAVHRPLSESVYMVFVLASFEFLQSAADPTLSIGMSPALVIHLWLPLFALSSFAVRLLFLIFRAVEWAQWFLKQGDAHPFKAIGIVATIIVFGSAMLVKEAWTIM
jgi:hypothetical protein